MARILVIDDEEDSRELVVQALQDEHEIYTLENWVHATDYIFQYNIDLILIDINMPGLKGDKLTEVLLKHAKSRPLNIVLFSGLDEAEVRQKTEQVKANGYILKTFDKNLLRTRVRRFLK
jgi:PleD family two-component response regulator